MAVNVLKDSYKNAIAKARMLSKVDISQNTHSSINAKSQQTSQAKFLTLILSIDFISPHTALLLDK